MINFLKDNEKKNERVYRLKPKHFSSWSKPMRVLSDVPVSRNWYKLCQIYTNICMFKSLYKKVGLNGSYSSYTQPIWKRRYPRWAKEA